MADAALERLRDIAISRHVPIALVRRMRTEYQQRKRGAKRTHVPEGEGAERAAGHLEVRRALHAAEAHEHLGSGDDLAADGDDGRGEEPGCAARGRDRAHNACGRAAGRCE